MTQPVQPRGREFTPPNLSRLRRIVLGGIAAFFLITILFPWLAGFATDWLWFSEIGYQSVFMKALVWRGLLFLVGGAFAFTFLYGNVRLARVHCRASVSQWATRPGLVRK